MMRLKGFLYRVEDGFFRSRAHGGLGFVFSRTRIVGPGLTMVGPAEAEEAGVIGLAEAEVVKVLFPKSTFAYLAE